MNKAPELDKDMDVIHNGLEALEEHFQKKGKKFICAYYLIDEETHIAETAIMPRKGQIRDLMEAYIRWGAIINDYITPKHYG